MAIETATLTVTVRTPTGTVNGTITYMYNAAGGKIRKTVLENGVTVAVGNTPYGDVNITTTTFYAGGQVYESKVYTNSTVNTALGYVWQLQHVAHEEGRMRAVRPTPQNKAAIALPYDYMLKDHLGNVRMPVQPKAGVLTDEQETIVYPTLSFEGAVGSAEANNQNSVWERADGQPINVTSVRTLSPGVLQNGPLTPPPGGNSLLVRSSTGKVGAGKLIKVMAGDRINTSVQYYYPSVGTQPQATGLNTLIAGLASVITNSAGSGSMLRGAAATVSQGVGADPLLSSFFTQQNNQSAANRPKAYLNVLFFKACPAFWRGTV